MIESQKRKNRWLKKKILEYMEAEIFPNLNKKKNLHIGKPKLDILSLKKSQRKTSLK